MTAFDDVFVGCHRGADKNGAMSAEWFQVSASPASLEEAMRECQLLFESGLILHPQLSEFRISRSDGTTVSFAKPPHANNRLDWASPASTNC
jgi:hypothetical protein